VVHVELAANASICMESMFNTCYGDNKQQYISFTQHALLLYLLSTAQA